jgi:hypothetical protein
MKYLPRQSFRRIGIPALEYSTVSPLIQLLLEICVPSVWFDDVAFGDTQDRILRPFNNVRELVASEYDAKV